jgi:aspartate racemase
MRSSPEGPRHTATIGLVGGLGVGAAIHYYRELAAAHQRLDRGMNLIMTHASVFRIAEYAARGDRNGMADYLAGFVDQLKAAGATFAVLPALTPHLCINELQAIAPIPVIDLTGLVAAHVHERKLGTVALFGTRYVVESSMYGRLANAVRPQEPELDFIHDAYTQLAHTGVVSTEDRERFIALADTLQRRDGVDAIVLAGTDFALMFDAENTPFPHVDCAAVHIGVIVQAADAQLTN